LRAVIAVLLALVTAVTYGVANYLGPLLARRVPLATVLLVGQLAAIVGAGILAGGAGGLGLSRRGVMVSLAAGAANGAGLALFYKAGQVGDLSVVAPIGSTGAVVPVVVSLLAGQRPGAIALLGIPVALAGIVLAAHRSPGDRDGGAPAVAWACAAALAFGSFLTIYASAAHYGAAGAVFWSRASLLGSTALAVAVLRAPLRAPLRAALPALLPGLLLVTGTFAFGEASRRGLLAVVSVIATLNPVVTVGLALLLLRERLRRAQQAGVVVALAGVVMLAAG